MPLKKHFHCTCERYSLILCDVHEDPEVSIESRSFAKQSYMSIGGYEEHIK